jgi:signal transduction histidine kinase
MLLSKEEKIKYLGFNDFWFIVIGTIILSTITDYLFNGGSFIRYPLPEAIVNWSISLLFSIVNWMMMRAVMIRLRKQFPNFKKSLIRISVLFLVIILIIILVDRLGSFVLGLIFGSTYNHPSQLELLIPILLISIMTLSIYEAIYFYTQLKKSVREEEQAKQVIVEAQLDALRNQARPHFLFNSLNTLRDIIENDPKSEAIDFVDKLSDVYRFILESGNSNLITLRDEFKFAQAYMYIQSERFGDNIQLDWQVSVDHMNMKLIPMSVQLLLENAIKHNVISKAKPLTIRVYTEDDILIVQNNIQAKSTQLPSTKIGLDSLQKRYNLISGQSLIITDDNRDFKVGIPLIHSSNN